MMERKFTTPGYNPCVNHLFFEGFFFLNLETLNTVTD